MTGEKDDGNAASRVRWDVLECCSAQFIGPPLLHLLATCVRVCVIQRMLLYSVSDV